MEQVLLFPRLYKRGTDTLVSIIYLRGIILVRLRSYVGRSFEEFDLFYSRTGKRFFTGQLIVNFHKGAIGKVQVTETLKSKELATSDSETLYYMSLVVLSLRLVEHRILRRLDNRVLIWRICTNINFFEREGDFFYDFIDFQASFLWYYGGVFDCR